MYRIHKRVYNHRYSWNLLLECTCQMDTVDRILDGRYFDRSLWDRMCTAFAFLPRMFRLDSALKRKRKSSRFIDFTFWHHWDEVSTHDIVEHRWYPCSKLRQYYKWSLEWWTISELWEEDIDCQWRTRLTEALLPRWWKEPIDRRSDSTWNHKDRIVEAGV